MKFSDLVLLTESSGGWFCDNVREFSFWDDPTDIESFESWLQTNKYIPQNCTLQDKFDSLVEDIESEDSEAEPEDRYIRATDIIKKAYNRYKRSKEYKAVKQRRQALKSTNHPGADLTF